MNRLYWMVLRSYFGPLILTFFIAVFILLMQFIWVYLDDMVGKGLEWSVIAELLFYASWTTVPMALPLSILLSSLMTFGNLGEHYELVAAKSAGISLWKIMRPLVFLSVIISCLAFVFSNNALPYVLLKQKSILYDIKHKKLSFNIKEGEFYHDIDGYVMRVAKKDKDGKTLHNILIYDHTKHDGAAKLTSAETGEMAMSKDGNTLVLTLENGCNYDGTTTSKSQPVYPMQRIYYEKQTMHFDISGFAMQHTDDDMFKSSYVMLNLNQLNVVIDSLSQKYAERQNEMMKSYQHSYTILKNDDNLHDSVFAEKTMPEIVVTAKKPLEDVSSNDRKMIIAEALKNARTLKQAIEFYKVDLEGQTANIHRHEIVRHQKFTLSFACLVLFFIGAPLGAIIRKGGLGLPVVMATFIFILFHVINMVGRKYAIAGVLPVWEGMWLSSFILFPFGLFLSLKANNDSPLFDSDVWKKVIFSVFLKKEKP